MNSGQATFNFHVQAVQRRNNRGSNFFNYSDPGAGIGFEGGRVDSLMIIGNHAHFSGTARISRRRTATFTVDVDDFVGCPDQFSIQMSNGYSATGEVMSGDISIHN